MPLASLDRVFPVHGAIIRRSSIDFGPIGSASGIVVIGGFHLFLQQVSENLYIYQNGMSVEEALSEKIVNRLACVSASRLNSSKTFL